MDPLRVDAHVHVRLLAKKRVGVGGKQKSDVQMHHQYNRGDHPATSAADNLKQLEEHFHTLFLPGFHRAVPPPATLASQHVKDVVFRTLRVRKKTSDGLFIDQVSQASDSQRTGYWRQTQTATCNDLHLQEVSRV